MSEHNDNELILEMAEQLSVIVHRVVVRTPDPERRASILAGAVRNAWQASKDLLTESERGALALAVDGVEKYYDTIHGVGTTDRDPSSAPGKLIEDV